MPSLQVSERETSLWDLPPAQLAQARRIFENLRDTGASEEAHTRRRNQQHIAALADVSSEIRARLLEIDTNLEIVAEQLAQVRQRFEREFPDVSYRDWVRQLLRPRIGPNVDISSGVLAPAVKRALKPAPPESSIPKQRGSRKR